MASATYTEDALVCKKTKLGETDIIVTLVGSDGAQIKAVAKGARKPTSPFSARLELGSLCHILLVEGKSLDIVKECTLIDGHKNLRSNYDAVLIFEPMLDFLSVATQESLANPKLFALTVKALDVLETLPQSSYLTLLCAYLLKALAFSGFKPSFDQCIGCGELVLDTSAQNNRTYYFSSIDGGVVCRNCAGEFETIFTQRAFLQWCQYLLYVPLDDVKEDLPESLAMDIIQLIKMLIQHHLQARLKSLDFLLQNYGVQP